jgi:hypothetical protein
MLGMLVGLPSGPVAFVGGYIVHLTISGGIAVLYKWGFQRVPRRSAVVLGIAFSFIHLAISGAVTAAVPPIHLHGSGVLVRPGPFLSNFGVLAVCTFITAHVVYGVIVGAVHDAMRVSFAAGLDTRGRTDA